MTRAGSSMQFRASAIVHCLPHSSLRRVRVDRTPTTKPCRNAPPWCLQRVARRDPLQTPPASHHRHGLDRRCNHSTRALEHRTQSNSASHSCSMKLKRPMHTRWRRRHSALTPAADRPHRPSSLLPLLLTHSRTHTRIPSPPRCSKHSSRTRNRQLTPTSLRSTTLSSTRSQRTPADPRLRM